MGAPMVSAKQQLGTTGKFGENVSLGATSIATIGGGKGGWSQSRSAGIGHEAS